MSNTQTKLDQSLAALNKVQKNLKSANDELVSILDAQIDLDFDDSGYDAKVKELEAQENTANARVKAYEKSMESAAKSVKIYQSQVTNETTPNFPASLPMPDSSANSFSNSSNEVDPVAKSVFLMRNQDLSQDPYSNAAMKAIYNGQDYRQLDYDQNVQLSEWIRSGGELETTSMEKSLRVVYPSHSETMSLLRNGTSVQDLQKAVQVHGISNLGGYAVNPERANTILQQAAGLTVMRAAGAIVLKLTAPSITWLKLETSSNIYPSGVTGDWVPEAVVGGDKNITLGTVDIKLYAYSYVIKVSTELLDYTMNMNTILNNIIATTLSIDEDRTFIFGDGQNKANGVLPNNLNTNNLTVKPSGDATGIKRVPIKKLRYGVLPQHRTGNRSYIANSATWEEISGWTDGQARDYYPDGVGNGDRFFDGTARETEAMVSPAAGTFPMIYGNMSGYAIAEGTGLRIKRHSDSRTTMRQVWFEVLAMRGGGVIEDWKMAVLEVKVA